MVYISIDPGETTGVCVVEWNIRPRDNYMYMLASAPWGKAKLWLNHFTLLQTQAFIIVERSPQRMADPQQLARVDYVVTTGKLLTEEYGADEPRLCVLSPGDWKPIAKARKWEHPDAQDQHQSDAFGLLRYYFWRTLKIEIPFLPAQKPRREL